MKPAPSFSRITILLVAIFASGSLFAQDAAAPSTQNGYTVNVDIKVNEKGTVDSVTLIDTNDKSSTDVLTKMAIAMAAKTTFPPRMKDGKPVKFTVRAPFFFPVEGDEGPAADLAPKPGARRAFSPEYPAALRAEGVTGGVVLELFVDETGRLTKLDVLRASHPEFAKSATEAVQKWEFGPARKDGQPVASRTRLAIAFETESEMADIKWKVAPRPRFGTHTVIRPDSPIQEVEPEPAPAASTTPADAAAPTVSVPQTLAPAK